MAANDNILFHAKPSLRREYLYLILGVGGISVGKIVTHLDPVFDPLWQSLYVGLAVWIGFHVLRRWCTSYTITQEEIRKACGILARQYSVLPHARITNAGAFQSFGDRLLGIATLQVDTAGGEPTDMSFNRITKGETLEAAEVIRSIRHQIFPHVDSTQDFSSGT